MDFRFLCFLILQATVVASLAMDRKEASSSQDNEGNGMEDDVSSIGLDPYTTIMATSWSLNYFNHVQKYNCSDKSVCDTYAGNITNSAYFEYDGVDFRQGARGLAMVLAQQRTDGVTDTGKIFFHVDQSWTPAFAEVVIGNTGGEQNWAEVHQLIADSPTGVHDMYVTFESDYDLKIGNIASFTFYQAN